MEMELIFLQGLTIGLGIGVGLGTLVMAIQRFLEGR